MSQETRRRPSLWVSIFRGLDLSRRVVLNLIFFFLLFAFLAALAGDVPIVPEKAALVLRPGGLLVEQLSGDPVDRAIDKATDSYVPETLMSDVLDAIASARDDDRIQAIYLDVTGLLGGGLDKVIRVAEALEDFRSSGKTVIANADVYEKTGYLIATAADELYLHDQGIVFLDGYSRFRTYYRDGIERLDIDWNVFKVGDFKSAVEPYLRNDMSDEARLANLEYLSDLWSTYLDRLAAAREVERAEVEADLADMVALLERAEGDLAQVALDSGLVDELAPRTRVRERMVELVGESEDGTTFSQIGMDDYLTSLADGRNRYPTEGDGVGVIVAKGTILDGSQPPGAIGGDSTAHLVRMAREDASVKAVVLRVDSGGGSAFASEVIRRELQLVRDAGKPVVVSMGSVAASGGYWISTASDEIWAHPATITGSIGIYGMFPTFQKPLAEYLGVNVDGVGTTWLGGAIRPDRALDGRVAEMFRMSIQKGYRDFLERVAEAREMSVEEVNAIAQGRVWSGEDALENGLVDQLGELDDAIASAAELAGLGDDHAVRVIEKEPDFADELLITLLSRANAWFGPFDVGLLGSPRSRTERRLLDALDAQRDLFALLDDPRGVFAHCECEVR